MGLSRPFSCSAKKLEFTGCVCLLMLLFKEVASMTIEKNIMATLKREMDKRGVNYAEFSAEINPFDAYL